MRSALGFLIAVLLLATPALAQQVPPYVYAYTIGTSPIQVLPYNPSRHRVIFSNPNANGLIAFCPVGPIRSNGAAFICAVNGRGSITLLPLGSFVLDAGTPEGPPLAMPSAWNAVASSNGAASTVLEFE